MWSGVIGCGISVQGRMPDAKHDDLDDPRPEQQNAAEQRDRTQPGNAAGDEDDTANDQRDRNDPEESREFDGYIAF